MTLELLRDLSHARLPLTVRTAQDIDKLRVLRAAGHVAAMLPATGAQGDRLFARVLAITGRGRRALDGEAADSDPPAQIAARQPDRHG
ncbi:hypothetical protein [Xylophilus sp.]|uniref:hypothetical protein n=1 Tax=Xylophilus sp. TaxID=2653893 RepID=UPI0013B8E131|nr:hypothetical protein [Xylophilus sp.]KAF1047402.1 MAG: hypothetical protein GAK38_01921 [Xylophilus sp.]